MATYEVSRLLIIDLKRFISVFIREIYTFNMKQKHRRNTVHGHGPKNSTRTHYNLARTQYDLRADLVNQTKNTVGTKAQRIRHERTQLKSRGNSKWNGSKTISSVTLMHNYSSLLFVYVLVLTVLYSDFLWSACIFQSILQVICQWQWFSDVIWTFGSGPNLKTSGGKVFW